MRAEFRTRAGRVRLLTLPGGLTARRIVGRSSNERSSDGAIDQDGPDGAHDGCRVDRRVTMLPQEAAVAAFRAELDQGMLAAVTRADGTAEQVRELPLDAELVVLRRPIAGG